MPDLLKNLSAILSRAKNARPVLKKLKNFYSIGAVTDFLFPPTAEERAIIQSSPSEFFSRCGKASFAKIPDVIPIFSYEDKDVKELIRLIKYKGNLRAANLAADILYDVIVSELSDAAIFENFTKPLLIPVPLSKKKLRERGFNQSERLARRIARRGRDFLNLNLTAFKKVVDSPSQTSAKTARERESRVRNCFKVENPNEVSGRNIILIDDVVTTGSTIRESRKVILAAGARRVIAFTIAH